MLKFDVRTQAQPPVIKQIVAYFSPNPTAHTDDSVVGLHSLMLHYTINAILVYSAALGVFQLITWSIPTIIIGLDILLIPFMLVTRWWYKTGRFQQSVVSVLATGFMLNSLIIFYMGTVYSPATPVYIILIIFAALYYQRRGVIVLSTLSAAAVLGLLLVDANTTLMPDMASVDSNPFPAFITYGLVFFITGLIVDGSINRLIGTMDKLRIETAERVAMAEQQATLLAAIDQSVDMVLLTDVEGRISYVNATYLRETNQQMEQVIGRNVMVGEGLQSDEPDEQIWQQVNNGQPYTGEMSMTVSAGIRRQFMVTVSPIYNKAGQKSGFLSIAEDITERKRAEQLQDAVFAIAAAAHSLSQTTDLFPLIHQRLCQVMDARNFYIALYDQQKNLISFPYMFDEMDDDIPEPYPPGKGVTARVLREGKPLLINADDMDDPNVLIIGERPLSWLGVPLKVNDDVIGVMAVQHYTNRTAYNEHDIRVMEFVSVTVASALNKIRVSEELAESNLRLNQMANNIAEAFWISTELQPNQAYLNPAAEKIFGFPIHQINEDNSLLLSGMLPPYDREYSRILDQQRRGLQTSFVFRYRRPDGQERWIVNNSYPVLDEAGKHIRTTGYARDITEEMDYQSKLREVNEKLETRVRERTEELETNRDELKLANVELEKASRMKDEFLASMSHELRTPLTGILGLTEALQYQTYGPLTDKQLYVLKNIELSGHHLLELINDVLDVSKIEADKLELNLVPCQLSELCQASLQLTKGMAHQKKIYLDFKITPAEIVVMADPRRVKQMLVNLISNAIKFTPVEGKAGLEVVCHPEQNRVTLQVWDSGIGISAEDQTRLFKPFVQLDASLSRQQTGTGLGLVLVSHLAEMHGGSIQMESVVGQGSRFTISLPWSETHTRPEERHTTNANTAVMQAKTPLRLALIDDNETILQTLTDHLVRLGHSVRSFSGGVDALAALPELRPDVIITDVQMPGMDGLEFMRRVRAQHALADVPIIALTALAMPGDEKRCHDAGANAYLAKPVSLNDLALALETTTQDTTKSP